MSIELIPLGTMVANLDAPHTLNGTPSGTRMIFDCTSGTFEGERLRGKLKGASSADWFVLGPDGGTGTLDVRALLETDDGALVFVQYNGRIDIAGGGATYVAPRFETGDERYAWLNKIQAVGKGVFDGTKITYEMYELR